MRREWSFRVLVAGMDGGSGEIDVGVDGWRSSRGSEVVLIMAYRF